MQEMKSLCVQTFFISHLNSLDLENPFSFYLSLRYIKLKSFMPQELPFGLCVFVCEISVFEYV